MKCLSSCLIIVFSCLLPHNLLATDPPPATQVTIETKFVEVKNDFEKELGFEWGIGPVISHMTGDQSDGNVVGMTAFGGVDALVHPLISVFGHVGFTQFGNKIESSYGKNKFKIGNFNFDTGIKVHLTPTPARPVDPFILVGVRTGVNAFGNQQYEFMDQKDREFFKLNDSDIRAFAAIMAGAGVTIRTNVLDLTAQVVILGGLTQLHKNNIDRSVPFMAEIPLIGRFFRKEEQKNRPNLLILVKADIVEPSEAD